MLFHGVPYAAPRVGELRFRPPQPAHRWREPLDATKPRNICAQPELFGIPGSEHEGCLYLNVTTPRRAHGRVLEISHDPEFDVRGYGEELVTIFDLATRGK